MVLTVLLELKVVKSFYCKSIYRSQGYDAAIVARLVKLRSTKTVHVIAQNYASRGTKKCWRINIFHEQLVCFAEILIQKT